MTNPHDKCFFLRLFISNIKSATDKIVSLLSLFISVFNLSLSDPDSQRSKLLFKIYSHKTKFFKSIFSALCSGVKVTRMAQD